MKLNAFLITQNTADMVNFDASEPVVILGFGQMGQVLYGLCQYIEDSGGS